MKVWALTIFITVQWLFCSKTYCINIVLFQEWCQNIIYTVLFFTLNQKNLVIGYKTINFLKLITKFPELSGMWHHPFSMCFDSDHFYFNSLITRIFQQVGPALLLNLQFDFYLQLCPDLIELYFGFDKSEWPYCLEHGRQQPDKRVFHL